MQNTWRVAGLSGLALAGMVAMGVAGCASPPADVAAAAGPKACINPTQIRKQEILSDQEIRFVMDNGDVWTNRLKRECQGLKFEGGFTWNVRGTTVCANEQIITVLNAGNTCTLGEFSKAAAPT
jgi:hypothetical protein